MNIHPAIIERARREREERESESRRLPLHIRVPEGPPINLPTDDRDERGVAILDYTLSR
jgi:hypothetical protein